MTSIDRKISGLRELLLALDPVIIAFSGGVDSTYLLKTAKDTLGHGVTAVTEDSELMTRDELNDAIKLAADLDVPHIVVKTESLLDPVFTGNPPDRCYHCKKSLYTKMRPLAADKAAAILDGTNHDDLRDYRPGIKAADELGVGHPLAETLLTKDEIRSVSRSIGLKTWDKESAPCLATRFACGMKITGPDLVMVEKGESLLRSLGLRDVRVRLVASGKVSIEVSKTQVPEVLTHIKMVSEGLKRLGFATVSIDREGYRQGNMNP